MYRLLRFVPKNLLSEIVGRLVHVRLPPPLGSLTVRWFANRYGIDMSSAAMPLESYRSIGELFVRDLEEGARPIEAGGLLSPVDGVLRSCGPIRNGEIPQVKGKTYSVRDFLKNDELAELYAEGSYLNFYLSPPDYHHIHAPLEGKVISCGHMPGTLWPVNEWSINSIPKLFTVNDRVACLMDTRIGKVAVVLIGATNVGHIELTFDDGITETKDIVYRHYTHPVTVTRGGRLGTFRMGSSVVVLCEPGKVDLSRLEELCPLTVRYGMKLAEID